MWSIFLNNAKRKFHRKTILKWSYNNFKFFDMWLVTVFHSYLRNSQNYKVKLLTNEAKKLLGLKSSKWCIRSFWMSPLTGATYHMFIHLTFTFIQKNCSLLSAHFIHLSPLFLLKYFLSYMAPSYKIQDFLSISNPHRFSEIYEITVIICTFLRLSQ